ncbi:MAG: hypoxanthine phosphoribosyltransferase [Bacilli bacterium]|nr:hypoxanthine phosphoribosyltransferase [Bacilli bacterium]
MKKKKVLITKSMLQRRIKELAKQIENDYKGKDLTVICLLKGSIYFTADLTKYLRKNVIVECMRLSSYEGTNSTGVIKMKLDLDEPVTGKHILIVEDIIDTGRTLSYLVDYLKGEKPASLKICTLLDKPDRRVVKMTPDYSGFTIPNLFVIGYGMDYDEKYRNLPAIHCFISDRDEEKTVLEYQAKIEKMLKK